MPGSLLPLASFHLRVGGRLALRALAPVAGLAAVGIGLSPDPDAFLTGLARSFAARDSGPAAPLLVALAAVSLAGACAPRIAAGLGGWIGHLPAERAVHRRSAWVALALVQAPLALALLGLALVAALGGTEVSAARLAGLPLLALAGAVAAMPVRRRVPTALAGTLAAAVSLLGSWPLLLLGALLLAAADRFAGEIAVPARRVRRVRPGRAIRARIAWRAAGHRLPAAWLVGLLPLGAGALFLHNNVLEPWAVAGATRLAGALSVALVLANVAESFVLHRPPWPWSRSLPWSSGSRAGLDALLLGASSVPCVLAAALLDPGAAVALETVVPWLALRAACAIRRAPERRTGAAGAFLLEAGTVAVLLALTPWVGPLLLAGAPLAYRQAARSEREQKVGRWLPLHHRNDGDPLAWGRP